MSESRDYRPTVFLPKTDFPMKAGLAEKEPALLARWAAIGLYERLRAERRGREKFILHDGPPYANGDMHIGHAMQRIVKDMVVRTQGMLGKDAPFVPGWDCHGLPIEWKVEEQYRAKKLNKDEVDPQEFRAECRAYAQHWVDVQRSQIRRLGMLGEWDNPYLTMDFESEAAIVAELLKFASSGQIYRGAKPVMWSPVEKTALAEAEVEYADITSTQIDVGFEIVESRIPELVGAYALVWTTTPWTIPVNQALAYGPDIEYVLVHYGDRRYLVAEDLCYALSLRTGANDNGTGAPKSGATRVKIYRGSDLAGTVALHPMARFFRHPGPRAGVPLIAEAAQGSGTPDQVRGDGGGMNVEPDSPLAEFFLRPRPFLPGDFVTTEQGTGLVHMAPDHGEDDFLLCKAHGIEPVFAVEGDGRYRADWAWLGGQGSVINPKFNAPDGPICSDLRAAGALLAASADYRHSYPHSWRSKAKVIFRATPQWFIAMDRALDGDGLSLRERALKAIGDTRWVPGKGENRIRSMVEGRPDWVISRQRAWGVPITLFVDRRTGAYLDDPEVNARIVEAVRAGGVDAWSEANAQAMLGNGYKLADYERVTDILDVWFDSGCTHAFVLESGRWPDLSWPADLYLEGSDQHRGWFQSSLLESCGTRARAPYKAVLTHGMTLDDKGYKQSKSVGNTTDPAALMRDYGADIVRLWTASVDFTEDHRIGGAILAGVADQYRKLRNTLRYLLGALDGWREAERVPAAAMPELDRWVLHRIAEIDAEVRRAVHDFDFNAMTTTVTNFVNADLSAFYFDVRKDSLYCDAPDDPKRRAYRTVLDHLFHALTCWLAPVLVFTAEEAWLTRFPGEDASIHLLTYAEVGDDWFDGSVGARWERIRALRRLVTEAIEPLRKDKVLGSSLEAEVRLEVGDADARLLRSVDFTELCIAAKVTILDSGRERAQVARTQLPRCERCWRHLPDVAGDTGLCGRCDAAVAEVTA